MANEISPAKLETRFGVIFGFIMIAEFLAMYIIGMKTLINTNVGLGVNFANYMFLPLLFVFLGCWNFKKNTNSINFSQALKIGVSIAFVAGLIYGLFTILFNLIFPEFVDETIAISKTAILGKSPNIKKEELAIQLETLKKFMNPFIALPVTLIMYSFFGLIYSLIIGGILKNEKI